MIENNLVLCTGSRGKKKEFADEILLYKSLKGGYHLKQYHCRIK